MLFVRRSLMELKPRQTATSPRRRKSRPESGISCATTSRPRASIAAASREGVRRFRLDCAKVAVVGKRISLPAPRLVLPLQRAGLVKGLLAMRTDLPFRGEVSEADQMRIVIRG